MATIPTLQELKDQAISDIENRVGRSAPLLPISVWEIIATMIAGVVYGLYKYSEWVRRQIFVESADEDALLSKGLEYGLEPNPATLFIFTGTATGTNGSNILAGNILTADGVTYVTTVDAVIALGVATLQLQATAPGASGNLNIADVLEFATPIAGVNRQVTVASVIQSGADSESLEDFRRRVTFRQQLPPQGGAVPDYVAWATEVSGIAEAFPFRVAPNFINVYPLTDDPNPLNRIPNSTKLTEVQNYLNDPIRKPMSDNVSALAFTEVTVDVEISDLVPNEALLRQQIEDQIESYCFSRRPRLFPLEVDAPNLVSTSDITTLANLLGAKSLTVTLEVDAAPEISYQLTNSQLAKLGTVTFL